MNACRRAAVVAAARALVLAAGLALAGAALAFETTVSDDWGRALPIAPRPARIVVLAPHLTELVAAAGALGQVAAVDPNSDYPETARALGRIRAYPPPGLEQLLALHADLVLVWAPGTSRGWVDAVERAGIRIYVSDPRTLADIPATLERIAAFSVDPGRAREAARAFRARLADLEARFRDRSPVPVFYQVWERPLVSLGSGDVTADALRVCGARNVFAHAALAAPQVTEEAVLAARPRLILASDRADSGQRWQQLGALAPQGSARFAYLEASSIQRPGPRILDAVERLCALVAAVR